MPDLGAIVSLFCLFLPDSTSLYSPGFFMETVPIILSFIIIPALAGLLPNEPATKLITLPLVKIVMAEFLGNCRNSLFWENFPSAYTIPNFNILLSFLILPFFLLPQYTAGYLLCFGSSAKSFLGLILRNLAILPSNFL